MRPANGSPRDKNIGFVSTRFEGTDGVSLETEKWADVLTSMGHRCFYFAGRCEQPAERSRVVPEAFFLHPDVRAINENVFRHPRRSPETSRRTRELAEHLKREIGRFVRDFGIDVLIAENALTIPMNIPLGLGLTEFIAENAFPTIAHHHDFYWERDRYRVGCGWDYLRASFPPQFPSIQHVVINSSADEQLGLRTGVSSMLIPNVMDFDHPPPPPGEYTGDLRRELGIARGERFILQPTRVVQRKGIEHSIELIDRLGIDARLVISHASIDEGDDYEKRIHAYAARLDVKTTFVANRFHSTRGTLPDGRKVYSLADAYAHADLVTYPSSIEGFGNAFLEAIYHRRPIVVNLYSIYALDIRPKQFRVIEFDGYIRDETVTQVLSVLDDPVLAAEMTAYNYEVARHHYSYSVLERRLATLLTRIFGETCPR